jgi:hypothetical protein
MWACARLIRPEKAEKVMFSSRFAAVLWARKTIAPDWKERVRHEKQACAEWQSCLQVGMQPMTVSWVSPVMLWIINLGQGEYEALGAVGNVGSTCAGRFQIIQAIRSLSFSSRHGDFGMRTCEIVHSVEKAVLMLSYSLPEIQGHHRGVEYCTAAPFPCSSSAGRRSIRQHTWGDSRL